MKSVICVCLIALGVQYATAHLYEDVMTPDEKKKVAEVCAQSTEGVFSFGGYRLYHQYKPISEIERGGFTIKIPETGETVDLCYPAGATKSGLFHRGNGLSPLKSTKMILDGKCWVEFLEDEQRKIATICNIQGKLNINGAKLAQAVEKKYSQQKGYSLTIKDEWEESGNITYTFSIGNEIFEIRFAKFMYLSGGGGEYCEVSIDDSRLKGLSGIYLAQRLLEKKEKEAKKKREAEALDAI